MGSLLMVRPRVLGSSSCNTDHKPRTVPIDLSETMQATDEYSIELPDGYVVDELPEPVKLDLGFASYQSTIEVKGQCPSLHPHLHRSRGHASGRRYPDLQKLAGVIATDEEEPRHPQEAVIRSPSIHHATFDQHQVMNRYL